MVGTPRKVSSIVANRRALRSSPPTLSIVRLVVVFEHVGGEHRRGEMLLVRRDELAKVPRRILVRQEVEGEGEGQPVVVAQIRVDLVGSAEHLAHQQSLRTNGAARALAWPL